MNAPALARELVSISPQEAVALGARSLTSFGRLFFPRTVRQGDAEFHETIGQHLYTMDRFNAFEVFRGGAKTSKLRIFAAQRVSYGISRTIMYVSVSQDHAKYSIRWLKKQVQYNTRWAQTFQLRKGDKWTDEVIEIYHGLEETPITILALGITGQIRGFNIDDYRPDLIIADDVCNEENTATPEQRKKLSELFFGGLVNSLAPASEAPFAKIVLLQTPLNKSDLVETCMGDSQWHGLRFSVLNEQNESRWPERFPTEVILRDKEAAIARGHYSLWMREMECKIVAGEQKTFDVTKLVFYDVLPEGLQIIITIDPASSDSPKADDHVIMVIGIRGLEVYVLDYHVAKGVMPDEAVSHLFRFILMYRPLRIAVETVAYQKILKWFIEQEMARQRVFLVVDPINDKRRKSDRIVQALAGLLSYGHLHIRPSMTELVTQMDDYDPQERNPRDDILDAMAMGVVSLSPGMRALYFDNDENGFEVIEGDYAELEEFRGAP